MNYCSAVCSATHNALVWRIIWSDWTSHVLHLSEDSPGSLADWRLEDSVQDYRVLLTMFSNLAGFS